MPLAGPSLSFSAGVQGHNDILTHASSHRIQRHHPKDGLKNKELVHCCFSPRCHWGQSQLMVSQKRGLAPTTQTRALALVRRAPRLVPTSMIHSSWALRAREVLPFCLSAGTRGGKEVLLMRPFSSQHGQPKWRGSGSDFLETWMIQTG